MTAATCDCVETCMLSDVFYDANWPRFEKNVLSVAMYHYAHGQLLYQAVKGCPGLG